jgi:hypothetical protein
MALQPKIFYGFGSYSFQTNAALPVSSGLETSAHVVFNNRAPLHITSITLSSSALQSENLAGAFFVQRMVLLDVAIVNYLRINDPVNDLQQPSSVDSGGQKLDDYKHHFGAWHYKQGRHHYTFGDAGLVILNPCILLVTPCYAASTASPLVIYQYANAWSEVVVRGYEEQGEDATKLKLR